MHGHCQFQHRYYISEATVINQITGEKLVLNTNRNLMIYSLFLYRLCKHIAFFLVEDCLQIILEHIHLVALTRLTRTVFDLRSCNRLLL